MILWIHRSQKLIDLKQKDKHLSNFHYEFQIFSVIILELYRFCSISFDLKSTS